MRYGIAIIAVLLLVLPAAAQGDIWDTVDGGGGQTLSNGGFTLRGTIGQPDVRNLNSGSFALSGGFWARPAGLCMVGLNGTAQTPATVDARALQDVLAAANPSDLVQVNGTCYDTSGAPQVMQISQNLTLNGGYPLLNGVPDFSASSVTQSQRPTLASDGSGRVLVTDSGATVTVRNVTLTGGAHPNGGGIWNTADLTILASEITGNAATSTTDVAYGGSIYNQGDLTLNAVTISDSSVDTANDPAWGGAILNVGTLDLINTDIVNATMNSAGSAAHGGAVYNVGMFTMDGGSITGTRAFGPLFSWGGAIRNLGGTVELDGVTLADNIVSSAGAAIASTATDISAAKVTVINSNIGTAAGSNMAGYGGAIINVDNLPGDGFAATFDLTDTTITNGYALAYGGGIFNYGGTLTMTRGAISDSTAEIYGGGFIAYNSSDTELIDVTISGNTAWTHGGGGFSGVNGTLTMTGGLFDGNAADGDNDNDGNGGGLWTGNTNAISDLTEVTFINNTAENGAALHNTFGGELIGTGLLLGVDPGDLANKNNGNGADAFGGGLYASGWTTIGGVGAQFIAPDAERPVPLDGLPLNEMAPVGEVTGPTTRRTVSDMLAPQAIVPSRTTIVDSIIAYNDAKRGGGVFASSAGGGGVSDAGVTLRNTTISNNDSSADAAGLWVTSADGNTPVVNIEFVTIAANSATSGASGAVVTAGDVNVFASIIAQNGSTDCSGTFATVVSSYTDSSGCTGLTADSLLALGALNDNGGTTLTHALNDQAQALDALVINASSECYVDWNDNGVFDSGTEPTLTVDQRSITRPVDGDGDSIKRCDAGAFEDATAGFGISGFSLLDFDVAADAIASRGAEITLAIRMNDPVDEIGPTSQVDYTALIAYSPDATCTLADTPLATFEISGLQAGEQATTTLTIDLPRALLYADAAAADVPHQGAGTIAQHVGYLCVLSGDGAQVLSDDITYFPWDVDGDGVVMPVDAQMILNRMTASDALADINGDGAVTDADVTAVLGRLGYLHPAPSIEEVD